MPTSLPSAAAIKQKHSSQADLTKLAEQLWNDRETIAIHQLIQETIESTNNPKLQTQTKIVKAYVLFREGDLGEAFELILKQLEQVDKDVWYVRAINVRNCVWLELGEFMPAIDGLKEQLRLAKEVNDLEMQGSAFHDLGVLHFVREPLRAEPFLENALEIFERGQINSGQAYACLNLAHVMHVKKQLATEIALLKRAEALTERFNYVHIKPHLLAQKGKLALANHDYTTAQAYLTQALEYSQTLGRPLAEMMPTLVSCYKQLGEYQALKFLLENHLEALLGKGFRPFAVQAHDLLSQLYEEAHDYKEALKHSREHIRLFQEVYTERQENKVRVAEAMYRTQMIVQKAKGIAAQNKALQEAIDELESLNQSILQRSQTDDLTGVYNRRYLRQHIETHLQDHSYCVAIVDLDHFKRINDNFGHESGDQVLKRFAQLLSRNVRSDDVVVRHGGEEFVLIFPGTSEKEVKLILEQILQAMKTQDWQLDVSPTFTAGLCLCADADLDKALRIADERLYFGKENGRNGVWLSTEIA